MYIPVAVTVRPIRSVPISALLAYPLDDLLKPIFIVVLGPTRYSNIIPRYHKLEGSFFYGIHHLVWTNKNTKLPVMR